MGKIEEIRKKGPQICKKNRKRTEKARWTPPPPEFVKINFDGSVLRDSTTSMGFTIRNELGKVIHVGTKRGRDASPLLTEALAMQFACCEASRLGYERIYLEGDNISVINAVLGIGRDQWEIDIIISDVRVILSSFQEVHIGHIFREANTAADMVAGLAHRLSASAVWSHPEFVATVRKDAFGG